MKIIKATDPILVEHPVFLLFGQPGICKTSLGYSADEPILLDADQGAHRAVNRRDTIAVDDWKDINELLDAKGALDPYKTIVLDTVGRVLDHLTVALIEENPKFDRGGGSLSLPGFGALKARFQTFLMRARSLGKDVVMIAHGKEDKDGDSVIIRPDVTGGSFAEIMKVADFVGYIYMRGKDRVLDFNPTDRWVGKNPAQWKPIILPPAEKATRVLAGLMAQGREALGAISGESAKLAQQVDESRAALGGYTTTEQLTRAVGVLAIMPTIVQAQVRVLIAERAKALGFTFDKATHVFVAPTPAVPTPAVDRAPTAQELGF